MTAITTIAIILALFLGAAIVIAMRKDVYYYTKIRILKQITTTFKHAYSSKQCLLLYNHGMWKYLIAYYMQLIR